MIRPLFANHMTHCTKKKDETILQQFIPVNEKFILNLQLNMKPMILIISFLFSILKITVNGSPCLTSGFEERQKCAASLSGKCLNPIS